MNLFLFFSMMYLKKGGVHYNIPLVVHGAGGGFVEFARFEMGRI